MTTLRHAINWFEIPAADLARAQRFYETVLGRAMKRETMGSEQMAIFAAEPEGGAEVVSGCLNVGAERVAPSRAGTRVYLDASPSIDAALERVARAGGRIHTPKIALPQGMGFFAHIEDTEGNVVGLHALG
jgi:predicted enzyme related to lactoylglutathione lyase